ncbi:MAG: ArnT family glycosyltransferase, partial [bacterium]
MGKETARQRLKGKKGSRRRTAHRKMAASLPILLGLFVLFMASLLLRGYGCDRPHNYWFDQYLYTMIGFQLTKDVTDYTSIHVYNRETRKGRDLPDHYNKPLFEHPPLYCYLISIVNRLSDPTNPTSKRFSFQLARRNGSRVSLIFGCLTIFVIYFLAAKLYDHRVGLLAALLLSIDPVHWICSQRVWMATTLAFFVASALLFYVLGRKRAPYFILSGICIGLASLTKLLGILTLFIILLYTLLAERDLFRKRQFIILIISPFILQIPWILWNIKVYGFDFLTQNVFWHRTIRLVESVWVIGALFAVLLTAVFMAFTKN